MLNFENKRILCIGDVMLDRFFYGATDRISPEAPVPVVRLARQERMLGGVGNVGRNIAALGAEAVVLGVAGEDDAGQELAAALAALPGIIDANVVTAHRVTTRKTRVIAGQQHIVRLDEETSSAITDSEAERLIQRVNDWAATCHAIILSDYAKGVLTHAVVRAAISAAHGHGIPVFVDPKRRDFAFYRGATVLTPNLKEMSAAVDVQLDTEAEIENAARNVLEKAGLEAILVTRSEKGMMLVSADGMSEAVGTQAREVYDVSGAGDTVIAVFALASVSGHNFSEAMHIANTAAGIVVSKLGTATVERDELLSAWQDEPHGARGRAALSTADALAKCTRWQSTGARVGLVRGQFDRLGRHELEALYAVRAQCDYLIVVVESAEDICGRPAATDDNVDVLANLAVVDSLVCLPTALADGFIETVAPSLTVTHGRPH